RARACVAGPHVSVPGRRAPAGSGSSLSGLLPRAATGGPPAAVAGARPAGGRPRVLDGTEDEVLRVREVRLHLDAPRGEPAARLADDEAHHERAPEPLAARHLLVRHARVRSAVQTASRTRWPPGVLTARWSRSGNTSGWRFAEARAARASAANRSRQGRRGSGSENSVQQALLDRVEQIGLVGDVPVGAIGVSPRRSGTGRLGHPASPRPSGRSRLARRISVRSICAGRPMVPPLHDCYYCVINNRPTSMTPTREARAAAREGPREPPVHRGNGVPNVPFRAHGERPAG